MKISILKRAIGPVLATTIFIVITLAAAIAIAGFVFDLFGTFTSPCSTNNPSCATTILSSTSTTCTVFTFSGSQGPANEAACGTPAKLKALGETVMQAYTPRLLWTNFTQYSVGPRSWPGVLANLSLVSVHEEKALTWTVYWNGTSAYRSEELRAQVIFRGSFLIGYGQVANPPKYVGTFTYTVVEGAQDPANPYVFTLTFFGTINGKPTASTIQDLSSSDATQLIQTAEQAIQVYPTYPKPANSQSLPGS